MKINHSTPRTPHPWEVLEGFLAGLLGFGGGDELQVLVGGDFGCQGGGLGVSEDAVNVTGHGILVLGDFNNPVFFLLLAGLGVVKGRGSIKKYPEFPGLHLGGNGFLSLNTAGLVGTLLCRFHRFVVLRV